MSKPARAIEIAVWGGLLFVVIGVVGVFLVAEFGRKPPTLPVYRAVPDFSLTNQFGGLTSLDDLRGQVWVADVIFTRCPGPCALMSAAMSKLQGALPPDAPVKLVSLTADPEFDTPEVLRRYGERFGASSNRWFFLTGKKLDLYRLATGGLMLAVDELKPDQRTSDDDLFMHSTLMVVVDKQGRIRASFQGTEPSSQPKIVETIRILLKENPS